MTNGDEGSAPMVIVLKYNADAIRQCSRKLVGEVRDAAGRGDDERLQGQQDLIATGTPSKARQN